MTFVFNDPKRFAADAMAGFVAANPQYVMPVHGGVVRSTASPKGEVALVIGGGSGHYPAFAGWTGPGMAHGSVGGNVFASPSESQVLSVSRAANNGGGILIMFGNYAGDVLHFSAAAKDLREDDGIDVRIVTITDDIASAPADKHRERRGIGGDVFVVKTTGAAIAKGANLDDAERVAWHANDSIRTLGVAYTGCTLPGATEPLFTVPEGKVALGLGIHGEPGISEHDHMSADELAELLVSRIMEEEPERTETGYNGRIAVIVNGLGNTKYEELFVLYGSVLRQLEGRDVEVVAPLVGEQVTSLDMAGVSLSIAFLDSELEELWTAPADTPALRTGNVGAQEKRSAPVAQVVAHEITAGSSESAAVAAEVSDIVALMAQVCIDAEADLGKLDSIAGDGDHGQGMVLGAVAARDAAKHAVDAKAGVHTLLDEAGQAWAEGAGGTSGALWGDAIRTVGKALDDLTAPSEEEIARAVVQGARNVSAQGGAKVGQKTMVDATEPFADALETAVDAGKPLGEAWREAAKLATEKAEATKDIVASKGRAKTHGEASLGHPDPGAVSFALLMAKVGERLA